MREKWHKKWNQECYNNNFSSSVFVIFLIFWPLENSMVDPFLNLIFTYFSIINNSGKVKEISSTSFYCIIPPSYLLKIRSWISQFSKPDNIWIYNIIKHLKFHMNYYCAFYFHATSGFMCLRNDKFRALIKYKISLRCALW